MKKLVTVYGIIVAVIVVLVIALLASCGPARSGKRVYTPIPPDSTVVLRALCLADTVTSAIKLKQRDNVYKVGDEVWVSTRDPKDLKIVNLSSNMPMPDNALSHGYYSRFRILPVK